MQARLGYGGHAEPSVRQSAKTKIMGAYLAVGLALFVCRPGRNAYVAAMRSVDRMHHLSEQRPVRRRVFQTLVGYVVMDHLVDDDILPFLLPQVEGDAKPDLEVGIHAPAQARFPAVDQLTAKRAGFRQRELRSRKLRIENRYVET